MSVRRQADERGSLIIAISVVFVLTGLALAVLARTVSAISSTRLSQDSSAALAAADAGLSDALYQLDQPPPMPATSSPKPVGAGTYQWRATQTPGDPNTYTIVSIGTVNGRARTVTETVARTPRYPFALFADHGVFFNSKSAGADSIRKAGIGSNHAIVIGTGTSGGGGGDSQTFYSPEGSCGGCPNPVSASGPYQTPDPVPPAGTLACPGGGPGGGLVDGRSIAQIISGGTYLCTGDVTLEGNVSVGTNPVIIYMTNGANGRGAPSTLHLGGLVMPATGDPTGLQILKAGPGVVDPGDSSDGAQLTGVIDAPEGTLNSSSCTMSLVGALVVGVFSCDGSDGKAFHLAYDDRVHQMLSDAWQTSGYHEIPTPTSI